eukprot:GHVU01039358.1.p1 GENE.GHVU01039358.1~~GHVU01039358.1.p1  ORF type:complete len:125 (+),score=1.15 GHVU01039358.1:151-525(+)
MDGAYLVALPVTSATPSMYVCMHACTYRALLSMGRLPHTLHVGGVLVYAQWLFVLVGCAPMQPHVPSRESFNSERMPRGNECGCYSDMGRGHPFRQQLSSSQQSTRQDDTTAFIQPSIHPSIHP